MIKRISNSEYLKRYGNMETGEKALYEKRVGEWLNAHAGRLMELVENFNSRLQDVTMVSAMWNDADCKAFEEGARLLSAMTATGETWLPDMLYVKAARRSVRQMVKVLGGLQSEGDAETRQSVESQTAKEVAAAGTGMATQPVADTTPAPVRPRHIDQYVHLLPKATQEKAAKVKDLLTDLDYAREQARLLADAPQASPSDRAAWASKATKIDAQVGAIYRELDAEWEKLVKQGRVVVDDLGNARVKPATQPTPKEEGAEDSLEPAELTSEQKARRRELRKFLTDTRRGNGKTREEHLGKWQEAWKEYLTLEPMEAALADEKIMEAAKHYGAALGSSDAAGEATEKPLPTENGAEKDGEPSLS